MSYGSGPTTKPAITQRELENFLILRRELLVLKRRVAEERDRLRQLVESRTAVEPGRLQVAVAESAQQLVTKGFLISIFGEEGYQEMRAEAPPRVFRRLVVQERGRSWSPVEQVRARTWTSLVHKDRP